MWNPETDLSNPDRPEPKATVVNEGTYETCDSLVFYLTKHLDKDSDARIRQEIEAYVEDFEKVIWYFDWPHEKDGTLEDVERIARECCVDGKPQKSDCIFFIDKQSSKDGKVLIVQCVVLPEEEKLEYGAIKTRGRLFAIEAPCAVVNVALGNMDLFDFLEGDIEEWGGELEYHHEVEEVDTDDDSLKNVGDEA